jgi:hypothetical protein
MNKAQNIQFYMKNNTHMGDKNILFIEFLNNKQQEI